MMFIPGVRAETTQNDGDVDITQYPYVVSIWRNGRYVCNGAILDEYHIGTSDRCVPPSRHAWNIMNDVFVSSGTSSLKTGGRRIYSKETFSQNEHFNPVENSVSSGLGVIRVYTFLKYVIYIHM